MKNKRILLFALIALPLIAAAYYLYTLRSQVSLPKTSPPPASQPTDSDQDNGLPQVSGISLPDGFKIHYYAQDVPGARSLAVSQNGIVYVGSRDQGNVYALVDQDGDKVADQVTVVDSGLNSPNGVALRDGDLFVAQIDKITKYSDIDNTYADNPEPELIFDDLPSDASHGWKYIAFGPDDKLYIPVGAPCNICQSDEPYAALHRINPDGSGFETVAQGIRNTVGFDWHPDTDVLWFTENGRDWLGDNRPPDELNKVTQIGQHFGYPFCHGFDITDPEFGEGVDCDQYQDPQVELGPHVAALGMTFYDHDQFPSQYQDKVFIAEHGSWNRSTPIGYRITTVDIEDGQASNYQVFAEGWLQEDGTSWGRPVDVITLSDDSLLVSDDAGGVVYRITYQ